MREELTKLITDYFMNSPYVIEWSTEQLSLKLIGDMQNRFNAMIEHSTTPQLWRVYLNLVRQNKEFWPLHCNPSDHLAIEYAGMYIGIEPDGYMHS